MHDHNESALLNCRNRSAISDLGLQLLVLSLLSEAIASYILGFNYLLNYWCSPFGWCLLPEVRAGDYSPERSLMSEPSPKE